MKKLNHNRRESRTSIVNRITPIGAAIASLLVLPHIHAAEINQPVTEVGTVEVKAKSDQEIEGYNLGITKVGKTLEAIKDIPQAITIIPKELIQDKNSDSLKDALKNVAGMTFNAGEGGRIGDNINLRGFYSFGDLYMDGIRDTAQYNRETFNLEQIDILRGSGSMLFGRGQAGGVINQVSKLPYMVDKSNVAATVGTNDYYRATVDYNKVLDKESGLAFRINAMKHDSKSTRDVVSSQREGIAPSLIWGAGTKNQITLSHYYLKTNNVPDYGVGFGSNKRPIDVPASTFSGTDRDYENNITNMTTLAHEYIFDQSTKLSTKMRKANYQRELWSNKGRSTMPPYTTLSLAAPRGAEEDTFVIQTDLNKKFSTGSIKHELLVGAEYLREDLKRWSYNSTACSSSIVSEYRLVADGCSFGYGNKVKINPFSYSGNSYAVYAQDMIEFVPKWKLLFGARQDWLRADYQSTSTETSLNFSERSYRLGLTYQPDSTTTYYFAWNNSFNPTADLYQLSAGLGYPAERSTTSEIGVKWELLDGDLSLRTAIYNAQKQWERNTDLESTGTLNSQKRHTNGIEFEFAGRISKGWEVFGGIALMDAKIDNRGPYTSASNTYDGSFYAGMTPRNAPRYSYNFWTTYKVQQNIKLGFGAVGVGDRLAYGLNSTSKPTPNVAPAYIRFDAMAQYDVFDNFTLRLNIQNLANAKIYESIYESGGFAVPGITRTFQLTGIYKF